MGSQSAQQQTSSAVFYDPQKGQYYTLQSPQSGDQASNIMFRSPILGIMGSLTGGNLGNEYRNYLGSSLSSTADRFTPKYVPTQYPEMNMLFPALNAGLSENILTSLLPSDNTQSSGAGRFLAPSNTSKGK